MTIRLGRTVFRGTSYPSSIISGGASLVLCFDMPSDQVMQYKERESTPKEEVGRVSGSNKRQRLGSVPCETNSLWNRIIFKFVTLRVNL